MTVTATVTTRTNRYAAPCAKCRTRVEAESGLLLRNDAGAWIVEHATATECATTPPPVVEPLTPGVYENAEGVFVVKPNRERTRLYAKRLVEIGGERLTEAGSIVQVEFVYAPGAIYRLTAADQMPLDKAKALTIRYGRCIVCGRRLKAAQSVERGIGPVCVTYFA